MKVLVLAPRGFHFGFLGCYGNDWTETATFDRLAAESVVFDQHFSEHPESAAARRTWRTGRYEIPTPQNERPRAPDDFDLLSTLHGHGIRTCLIVEGEAPADFATGWDRVVTVSPKPDKEATLERMLRAVHKVLDSLADVENWLVWVDLATLLAPWHVPLEFSSHYFETGDAQEPNEDEEEGEALTPLPDPATGPLEPPEDDSFLRMQGSYAAAVSLLDSGLAELREGLEELGLDDDVCLVVTTDHGQALGEHGVVGACRPWLHEEVIHLPLLLRMPGAADAGRRVAAITQSCDLAPTLLDLFGLPAAEVHGQSLLPLASGRTEAGRGYAVAGLRVGEALEWALRTPDWSFLLPVDTPSRSTQLYVKPDDRWEVNNVIQHHFELAEGLEQTLRQFVEATRQPGPLRTPELPETA